MGLVHDTYSSAMPNHDTSQLTKDNPRLASILPSKQAPNTSKLLISFVSVMRPCGNRQLTYVLIARSTLTDDTTVPPSVIVKIQHGISTRLKNALDQGIVFGQEGLVEGSGSLIVSDHVLPSEGESEAGYQLSSEMLCERGRRRRETHRLAPFEVKWAIWSVPGQ